MAHVDCVDVIFKLVTALKVYITDFASMGFESRVGEKMSSQ